MNTDRYQCLHAMADDIQTPYQFMRMELQFVNAQNLYHAREGFDFWYDAFLRVETITNFLEIDEFIESHCLSRSKHACSRLRTVEIGMMAFCNALRAKHHLLFDAQWHTTPHEAIRQAFGIGPDAQDAWEQRFARLMDKHGIQDIDRVVEEDRERWAEENAKDLDLSKALSQ